MSADGSVLTWLTVLGGLVLKSLLVFLVAGAALLALRRASASARHLVCLLTLAALLALPVLSLALPGWRLAVLASPAASPAPIPSPPVAATMPAPVETEAPMKVVPFAPPSARLAPLLVLPPIAAASAPRPFPWAVVLSALWLGGVLLAGLRPLLGLWGIARLSQGSRPNTDAPTLTLASECASALGLPRTPALRQADAPVPMTWGWRRPVILLPADAHGWPEERLRAVLLHELAHVRRRDWLAHRFADVVCALYWFHPLAWLTARRLRAEGEIACDDLVLTAGVAAPDYARHLLDVARACRPASAVPQAAIAMARTARLEGRLTMILDTTRPRRALTRRVLLLVLGLSAAALVPLAVLRPSARAQAARPSVAALFVAPAAPTLSVTDLKVNGAPLLAGVTDGNLPGNRWWTADGAALPNPVYTPGQNAEMHDFITGRTNGTVRNLIFAFRLPPTAKDVTTEWELPQSLDYSSGGTWITKTIGHDDLPEAKISGDRGGVRTVSALYPLSASKASIRVGIASGPWTTVATQSVTNDWFGTTKTSAAGTFIFSRITEVDGGRPAVTITTDQLKQDIRIVAVDAQGHDILPSGVGGQSTDRLDQITAEFSLSSAANKIKQIRVETRPFRWVEIKDIALRPAK